MNRRDFLKTALYSAAAVTLPPIAADGSFGPHIPLANAEMAFSTRPLSINYSGALATYRRASDNAEITVYANTPEKELEQWSEGETDIYLCRMYDQTGNGNDMITPEESEQPTVPLIQ